MGVRCSKCSKVIRMVFPTGYPNWQIEDLGGAQFICPDCVTFSEPSYGPITEEMVAKMLDTAAGRCVVPSKSMARAVIRLLEYLYPHGEDYPPCSAIRFPEDASFWERTLLELATEDA
jgi:hypothetical protein